MTTIKLAGLLSITAVLFLAGCGKNKSVLAMEEFAEKTCACKDAKCLADLSKDQAAMTKATQENPPTSEGDAKAYAAASTKMVECQTKIAMSGMPAMPAMPK